VWGENGSKKFVVVAVPRFLYTLSAGNADLPSDQLWDDATIQLPIEAPAEFENIFTGERIRATDGKLRCAELFRSFPVCVLKRA
jgi:(1->4)-alpha-D-glucan 1-alpha-D-glucosylmutase